MQQRHAGLGHGNALAWACSAPTVRAAGPTPRSPSAGRRAGRTISVWRSWRTRSASSAWCRSRAGRATAASQIPTARASNRSPGRVVCWPRPGAQRVLHHPRAAASPPCRRQADGHGGPHRPGASRGQHRVWLERGRVPDVRGDASTSTTRATRRARVVAHCQADLGRRSAVRLRGDVLPAPRRGRGARPYGAQIPDDERRQFTGWAPVRHPPLGHALRWRSYAGGQYRRASPRRSGWRVSAVATSRSGRPSASSAAPPRGGRGLRAVRRRPRRLGRAGHLADMHARDARRRTDPEGLCGAAARTRSSAGCWRAGRTVSLAIRTPSRGSSPGCRPAGFDGLALNFVDYLGSCRILPRKSCPGWSGWAARHIHITTNHTA